MELQGFTSQSCVQNLSIREEKISLKSEIFKDIPSDMDVSAPHIEPDLSISKMPIISQEKFLIFYQKTWELHSTRKVRTQFQQHCKEL